MNDKCWHLLGKMLSKEATDDELKELHRLRSSNPEIALYIEELSKWWESAEAPGGEAPEQAFQKHLEKMQGEDPSMPFNLQEILEKGKSEK